MTIQITTPTTNISGSITFPDNPSPRYDAITALIHACLKSGSSLRCNINGIPHMIGSEALRESVIRFDP